MIPWVSDMIASSFGEENGDDSIQYDLVTRTLCDPHGTGVGCEGACLFQLAGWNRTTVSVD